MGVLEFVLLLDVIVRYNFYSIHGYAKIQKLTVFR